MTKEPTKADLLRTIKTMKTREKRLLKQIDVLAHQLAYGQLKPPADLSECVVHVRSPFPWEPK